MVQKEEGVQPSADIPSQDERDEGIMLNISKNIDGIESEEAA